MLWQEAKLYCKLPHGYVDPNTYYLEEDYQLEDNILRLDDLNKRASLPPATIDLNSKEGYATYGNSVLSRFEITQIDMFLTGCTYPHR